MNLIEYNKRLAELAHNATEGAKEAIYVQNGNQLLANIKRRIQKEGKDSSGQEMPAYSQKPGYYTKDQFVKKSMFVGKGKNGDTKFKNGNARKSMYLQHGYKELRDIQGRQTDHRDYTYSGDLMLSYVLGTEENAIVLGFSQLKQSVKRKAIEKKNGGEVFSATEGEMSAFNNGIIKSEKEAIEEIFAKIR